VHGNKGTAAPCSVTAYRDVSKKRPIYMTRFSNVSSSFAVTRSQQECSDRGSTSLAPALTQAGWRTGCSRTMCDLSDCQEPDPATCCLFAPPDEYRNRARTHWRATAWTNRNVHYDRQLFYALQGVWWVPKRARKEPARAVETK